VAGFLSNPDDGLWSPTTPPNTRTGGSHFKPASFSDARLRFLHLQAIVGERRGCNKGALGCSPVGGLTATSRRLLSRSEPRGRNHLAYSG